jgi:hypothetical protein
MNGLRDTFDKKFIKSGEFDECFMIEKCYIARLIYFDECFMIEKCYIARLIYPSSCLLVVVPTSVFFMILGIILKWKMLNVT